MVSASLVWPVSMITGARTPAAFSWRQTSRPSRSGRFTSSAIRSGLAVWARLSPSAPVAACAAMNSSPAVSCSTRSSRRSGSSSTTRIVLRWAIAAEDGPAGGGRKAGRRASGPAFAEQRLPDAHGGGAEADRRLEVGAHPHRKAIEPVPRSDPGEEREVHRRLLVERRDTHEPLDAEAVFAAAGGDEAVGVGRRNPGLLRFLASVDLDVEARRRSPRLDGVGQRPRQPRPVERLDDVEQGERVLDLVRLQRADQPQFEPFAPAGPAALGLLHPVLAEAPLARGEDRLYPLPGLLLADGDQRHVGRVAAGGAGGGGHARFNRLQAGI